MILCGIIILALIIMICIDSNRFVIRRYEVKNAKIDRQVKLAFITDLHNKQYGKNNEKVFEALAKIQPDYVLVGGDIVTARPGVSLSMAESFMKRLSKEYRVIYANGNHEQRMKLYPETYGDMAEKYADILTDCRITPLVNETAFLRDVKLAVTGVEIDRYYYKRFGSPEMKPEYLMSLLKEDKKNLWDVYGNWNDVRSEENKNSDMENYFRIWLAHNPVYFDTYAQCEPDLVLSGHVHGGVVRLPFLGGVLSTNFTLFPKYDGGRFISGKSEMILSRGLGAHTIPWRLWNPGELVEITLNPCSETGEEGISKEI